MKEAKILIVDDEEMALLTIAEIISDLGNVYTAETGNDAINTAKHEKPDLILLDINLDDMSGFDVKKALDDEGLDIPCIYITTTETYASDAYKFGGVDFITKPIMPDMTRNRVKNQLDIALSKRQLYEANLRFNAMVNSLSDAIFLTDKNDTIIECNNAAEKLTGYTSKEMAEVNINDVVNLSKVSNNRNIHLAVETWISENAHLANAKYLLENRSGDAFEVSCIIEPIFDKDSRFNGSTICLRVKKELQGNFKFLNETEMLNRIRYLAELVNNQSSIANSISLYQLRLTHLADIECRFGFDALLQIKQELVNSLTSNLRPETIIGFLDNNDLIVAIPQGKHEKQKTNCILSLLPQTIFFFGEDIELAFTNTQQLFDEDMFIEDVLEELSKNV
ncbi:hypothetical protein BM526_18865 (plasmid) [Alteromonas mediterranea]|uniref:ATP-binding response regulator n=1 Tax=Alteromonas mediterranea TaxID=314275 RepID=UPI000903FD1A|nr:response regulator [Alteromonas mediterranea]APE04032.1 hypothetical protein BM526_18865 [Alteromonas mediterranea]